KFATSSDSWPTTGQFVAYTGDSNGSGPVLAMGPQGDAVIAWQYEDLQSTFPYTVGLRAASHAAGAGTWGGAHDLAGPATTINLSQPTVAFDAQDRATVLDPLDADNSGSNANPYALWAWTRAAGASGSWSATQVV